MAILKIARMGHPALMRPALPVSDPTAPEVAGLVEDMIETMEDAGGVGLAAPQVHVPWRLVIFFVPEGRGGADSMPLTVLINPEIAPLDENMEDAWEGCLSLPGLTGLVPRHRRIRYTGFDLSGARIEREAEGFHARVVQHECDHLDGCLYPMRMRDMSQFGFVEDMRRGAVEQKAEKQEGEIA